MTIMCLISNSRVAPTGVPKLPEVHTPLDPPCSREMLRNESGSGFQDYGTNMPTLETQNLPILGLGWSLTHASLCRLFLIECIQQLK